MRAEEGKGNNKRGESPLSSSGPADNDDNKDENALSALTNAADIDEEEEEEGETTEETNTQDGGGRGEKRRRRRRRWGDVKPR